MNCECGGETRVINTRTKDDNTTRRRRECQQCKARFTTVEVIREEYEESQALVKPAYREALKTMFRAAAELGRAAK